MTTKGSSSKRTPARLNSEHVHRPPKGAETSRSLQHLAQDGREGRYSYINIESRPTHSGSRDPVFSSSAALDSQYSWFTLRKAWVCLLTAMIVALVAPKGLVIGQCKDQRKRVWMVVGSKIMPARIAEGTAPLAISVSEPTPPSDILSNAIILFGSRRKNLMTR